MNSRRSMIALLTVTLICGCQPDGSESPTLTTTAPAERLNEITENSPPGAVPWQQNVTGTVLELFPHAVKVQTEDHLDGVVMATSGDVTVYRGGNEIEFGTLAAGDRITALTERRGNRVDGWQSLVVQINVSASSRPTLGVANDGDEADLIVTPSYPVKLSGVFVEAGESTITIRDVDEIISPSTLAIDPSAVVHKGEESGDTSLLEPGDLLELTSESRGNRQDGWIDVITEVRVEDPK